MGLALNLPAPLTKPADASLPVRFENQLTAASLAGTPGAAPLQDRLSVEIGTLGALSYLRELGPGEPKVLGGSIALGVPTNEARGPASGSVDANLRFGALDVDAWEAVLSARERRSRSRQSRHAKGRCNRTCRTASPCRRAACAWPAARSMTWLWEARAKAQCGAPTLMPRSWRGTWSTASLQASREPVAFLRAFRASHCRKAR